MNRWTYFLTQVEWGGVARVIPPNRRMHARLTRVDNPINVPCVARLRVAPIALLLRSMACRSCGKPHLKNRPHWPSLFRVDALTRLSAAEIVVIYIVRAAIARQRALRPLISIQSTAPHILSSNPTASQSVDAAHLQSLPPTVMLINWPPSRPDPHQHRAPHVPSQRPAREPLLIAERNFSKFRYPASAPPFHENLDSAYNNRLRALLDRLQDFPSLPIVKKTADRLFIRESPLLRSFS